MTPNQIQTHDDDDAFDTNTNGETDDDSSIESSSSSSEPPTSSSMILPPPPSTPMTNDTPVRLRPSSTGRPSSITTTPRFSSPDPNPNSNSNSNSNPDGEDSTTSGGNGRTDAPSDTRPRSRSNSYQDLWNRTSGNSRSNPRRRTPMRNSSAVGLNGVNRSTITSVHPEEMVEEQEQDVVVEGGDGEGVEGGGHMRLGAGLAVGTVLRDVDLAALHQERLRRKRQENEHPTRTKSLKQGPSLRKVRRWNNDKFVGIATELSHANNNNNKDPDRGSKIAELYAEAELYKHHYTMPNSPMVYSSSFTTLLNGGRRGGGADDGDVFSDGGGGGKVEVEYDRVHVAKVKERFLRGETCTTNAACHGRPTSAVGAKRARERLKRREGHIFSDGRRMVRTNVRERLLNVVRRACRVQSSLFSNGGSVGGGDGGDGGMTGFSRKVLCAFEQTLVKHLSSSSSPKDDKLHEKDSLGIHLEDTEREQILEKVLLQKPLVTKKTMQKCEDEYDDDDVDEVKNVTLRFLFANDKPDNSTTTTSSTTKKTASGGGNGTFNRLMLHAVCQFHGLETAWSTTSRGQRLLTVMGVCKGCQFRMLDFLEEEEDGGVAPVKTSTSSGAAGSDTSQSLLQQSMSALKVS